MTANFSLRHTLVLIVLMGVGVGIEAIATPAPPAVSSRTPDLHPLRSIGQQITVKVLAGPEGWGSGILIQRQGAVYTVLTNDHVLGMATHYRIQTPDHRIYWASRLSHPTLREQDLALLQFYSPRAYELATMGDSTTVAVGDAVVAVGFPSIPDGGSDPGFVLLTGEVTLVADRPLTGGYQIGYSNPVVKGMSGGALLNQRGEVIGVNGMHAYPLWGGYVYADGSKPTLPLELMRRSSWAIPIHAVQMRLQQRFHPSPIIQPLRNRD